MKKLTFLVCLMAISLTLVAQGKITYVLNGGITNDYGWTCPQDMFDTFLTEGAAFFTGDITTVKPLDSVSGDLGGDGHFAKQISAIDLAIVSDAAMAKDFGWLFTYMDAKAIEAGQVAATSNSAFLRFNIGAFFKNDIRLGWPYSGDYTSAGVATYDAYKDYWKGGFAGPAGYAEGETVVLTCVPYPAKPEEESFLGWYKDAECTEEITEISGTGDVTVYAKFGEYIHNCAEVAAMPDDTIVNVAGTVSRVCGAEFWIQDIRGGLMCYTKNHGLVAGEEVILKGTKTTYGGIPELKNITVESKTAGKVFWPQMVLFSDIVNDSVGKYTSELVKFEGVRVKYVTSGDYTYPYLYDGEHEIMCYKITLDQTAIPAGSKVSATLVVSEYNGAKQLRGLAEDIVLAAPTLKDPYAYPAVLDEVSGNQYLLTNNWLYSNVLGNWQENRPNPLAEGTRSILHKDGIVYFPYRSSNQPTDSPYIVRVDAKTGYMLDPVYFADSVFKKDGEYIFGPFNDMKMDNAGNVITSNLPTAGGYFQIWSVDLETGGGKLLINHTDSANFLKNLFPNNTTIRLDRIGVYGDITKDAIIMSACANGPEVYYWYIRNGKWDGKVGCIKLAMEGNVGGAPTICPIVDDYFYVDGFNTYPILFDPDGNIVDDFTSEAAKKLLVNIAGTNNRSTSLNGVREFEINGEYYLLIAGDYSTGPSPSTFVLYKFKDKNRSFAEMTQLYEFPHAGMGSTSNSQRVAVSDVAVDLVTGTAEIYVFTAENGYGSYTFQGKPAIPATSVTLQAKEYVMQEGSSYQLHAMLLPAEAYQGVTWTTSNPSVVTVQDGLLQAVGEGVAVVTATAVAGNVSTTCTITVLPAVKSVELNETVLQLDVKKSVQLVATVLPENAYNKNVVWTTSNSNVALVTDGLVVGIGAGEAAIVVTTEDGGFTDTCWVTVTVPAMGIVLKPASVLLAPGSAEQLLATVLPANATNQNYTLRVDNPAVVTLLEDSWIIARAEGTALVTATTEDGGHTATCEVTVRNGVEAEVTTEVIVNPSTNSVDFVWSSVTNAASYVFVIYEDNAQQQKLCTLTFNARGQLTNINFSRNKRAAASEPQDMFCFTVTGLDSKTDYAYTMGSYDDEDKELESTAGVFSTTSSTTGLENVNIEIGVQKVLEDGTIYILRGDEKYTVEGLRVE